MTSGTAWPGCGARSGSDLQRGRPAREHAEPLGPRIRWRLCRTPCARALEHAKEVTSEHLLDVVVREAARDQAPRHVEQPADVLDPGGHFEGDRDPLVLPEALVAHLEEVRPAR